MFIATLGVALSVTVTLIYLIFYCMSQSTQKVLRTVDLNFQLLAIYVLFLVFLEAELSLYPIKFGDTFTLKQLLQYLTISIYILNVILIQYDFLRVTVWWITFAFFVIVFTIDLCINSHRQVLNFYVPMIIVLSLLAISGLFVFFHMPERFCIESRIPQLFFQSHFWFSLLYLLVFYTFLYILWTMFRYNEQTIEENGGITEKKVGK